VTPKRSPSAAVAIDRLVDCFLKPPVKEEKGSQMSIRILLFPSDRTERLIAALVRHITSTH
jgi:hypothetical protein